MGAFLGTSKQTGHSTLSLSFFTKSSYFLVILSSSSLFTKLTLKGFLLGSEEVRVTKSQVTSIIMENNSMDLVHGAAIYQQDNFSFDNNITAEEFLKGALGPQRQDNEVKLLGM